MWFDEHKRWEHYTAYQRQLRPEGKVGVKKKKKQGEEKHQSDTGDQGEKRETGRTRGDNIITEWTQHKDANPNTHNLIFVLTVLNNPNVVYIGLQIIYILDYNLFWL